MAENTAIEWADRTFNPWIGCTKVSPACDHCYAESWARRTGQPQLWQGERRRTTASNWQQPLKWNRKAEQTGRRDRVFCASLADVFDNQVPPEWRADLWSLIGETPHLDWLLLTKRPQNARAMIQAARRDILGSPDIEDQHVDWPWPNVWLGTTVENQAEADRRIPHLLAVPARVHFLSCEPLLGPVDLTDITWPKDRPTFPETDDLSDARSALHLVEGSRIDWVITGGESGPGARPSHPDWFRTLRDQCAATGVTFFHKQNGEWIGECQRDAAGDLVSGKWEGSGHDGAGGLHYWDHGRTDWSIRIGKKHTGRLLDGVEHNGMPAHG